MGKEICEDCGAVFEGTVHTHYCPGCRTERLRRSARERGLHRLGRAAYIKRREERDARHEDR